MFHFILILILLIAPTQKEDTMTTTFKATIERLGNGTLSYNLGEKAARGLFPTSKNPPRNSSDPARAFGVPVEATEATFQPATIERVSATVVQVTVLNRMFKTTKADPAPGAAEVFAEHMPTKSVYKNPYTAAKNKGYETLTTAVVNALTLERTIGIFHKGGCITTMNPHTALTKERIDRIHGQISKVIRYDGESETIVRALLNGETVESYVTATKDGDKDVYTWTGPASLYCPTGTKGKTALKDVEGMTITLGDKSARVLRMMLATYEAYVAMESEEEDTEDEAQS
tara:strand:+ start:166 stop:1026 length:861 start_codon:yes stop_codon:yes gene_type:complete